MKKYCSNCGKEIDPNADVCIHCGVAIKKEVIDAIAKDPNSKSKIVAGLLGIFLGSFGVHNFYLGYNGKAVTQLLITLLTCGIGASITYIWGLIEGILILVGNIKVDASGKPLSD